MDVFLIPTTTPERFELYYEAPDDEPVEETPGRGWLGRWLERRKQGFNDALREAEEWRLRRHDAVPEPVGLLARARRKAMGFIVERIAEQRLLWHLRTADTVCAFTPLDIDGAAADGIIRAILKKDSDHHLKWLVIDFLLLVLSAPLMVVPGPNVPGFYFTFQVVSHFLSWRGAKNGLQRANWTFLPTQDLSDVRDALSLLPPQRQHRFRELAGRLRLEHLPTFLDDVAAPPV